MNWTTDKPLAPGWYWMKEVPTGKPRMVEVAAMMRSGRTELCALIGAPWRISDMPNWQWAGPIQEPV